jgi:hypothetical protein
MRIKLISCCLWILLIQTIDTYAQGFVPASANATIYNGFVVGVTVDNGGAGYYFPPVITFTGGGGAGAGAYSIVSNGVLTQIVVTNAGSGYATAPAVGISAPGNFSFNSANAYIQVPTSPSLEGTTNQLTVECWFNRSVSQGDWSALVSKDPAGYITYSYELRFDANLPVGTFHVNPSVPYGDDLHCSRTPPFPAWHHYAMQLDGTNASVWMDGVMIGNTNAPGQPVISTYPLSIGSEGSGGFYQFNGYIDEVRISNIARYTSSFQPQLRFVNDTNTVALYHFDEGQGSIVHDASGNGNDGTIYGSSAWSTNVPFIPPFQVNVHKAVYLDFSNLQIGTNYQVQVTSNLYAGPWVNFGSPFTATNSTMTYTNYWNVDNWGHLFFRLSQ